MLVAFDIIRQDLCLRPKGGRAFVQRAFVQLKYHKLKIRNKNGNYKILWFTFTQILNKEHGKEK